MCSYPGSKIETLRSAEPALRPFKNVTSVQSACLWM